MLFCNLHAVILGCGNYYSVAIFSNLKIIIHKKVSIGRHIAKYFIFGKALYCCHYYITMSNPSGMSKSDWDLDAKVVLLQLICYLNQQNLSLHFCLKSLLFLVWNIADNILMCFRLESLMPIPCVERCNGFQPSVFLILFHNISGET